MAVLFSFSRLSYLRKKRHHTMAVENEVVRFIAQIDLDPQDQAAFTANLKKASDSCEELRQTISQTSQAMAQMRARGEENSEEYKKHAEVLTQSHKKLKEQTKEANKYSSALDKNQMSIKQLREHSKQLRAALTTMHKEANPKLWEKYNKELEETEDRLKELKLGSNGAKDSLLSMDKLKGALKSPAAWFAGAAAGAKLLWEGFQKMTEQTQVWGDKWTIATAKFNAGWNQLIANIGQGRDVIKASISEAMEAAESAQLLRDELFERENSYKITESASRTEIASLQAIAQDSSKSAKERLDALDKIMKIEENLAATRKSIASQAREAALKELKTRAKLTEEELKIAIDNYEQNRDTFKLAEEHNALLADRAETETFIKTLRITSSEGTAEALELQEKHLEELNKRIDEASPLVQKYAAYLRQYNLANDNLVQTYVEGTLQMQQADLELETTRAGQARRRGTLNNQIETEAKKARDEAYHSQIDAADKAYKDELNALKKQLLKKSITESEFNAKSLTAEREMLEKKKTINITYGKDVTDIEARLLDQLLSLRDKIESSFDNTDLLKEIREKAEKDMEQLTAEIEKEWEELQDELVLDDATGGDSFSRVLELQEKLQSLPAGKKTRQAARTNTYNEDMADLQEAYNLKLIAEEEFLERKKQLNVEYQRDMMNIEMEGAMATMEVASQFLNSIAQLTSTLKEAEVTQLDAQMQKELALAGDNAEKRQAIEEKYEAKKLEVQKKYADVDMGINIAQALAAGAIAVMQCLAQLGPIAGGIMAGIVAATTAAQVAVIIAQRNAIKNAAPGTSSSAVESSGQSVVGFSEGGYTGDGGRLEVAGVVHRGEYVVPQPEMRDPAVAAMVAGIESKRRRRTSSHALPGFAEGGYTGAIAPAESQESNILSEILALLYSIADTPIPAYVSLSELDAQQDIRARFKKQTSLKNR